MLMNQLMTTWKMEMIGTLKITKFKCKICKKEIIGKFNFKVHMENVHKGFKKNSNVMSVAKISHKILD